MPVTAPRSSARGALHWRSTAALPAWQLGSACGGTEPWSPLPSLPTRGLPWRVGSSHPTGEETPREAPAGASAGGLCGARRGAWARPPPLHVGASWGLSSCPAPGPPLPSTPACPTPSLACSPEGLHWASSPAASGSSCRGNGWACVPLEGPAGGSALTSTPASAQFQTVPWGPLGCAPQLPCPKIDPGHGGGGWASHCPGRYLCEHG